MALPLMAIASVGKGIYDAYKSGRAEKDAKKQGAMAQGLAKDGDARARASAEGRYRDLGTFRSASQGALTRAQLAAGREPQQITNGMYDGVQANQVSGLMENNQISGGRYLPQVDAGLRGVANGSPTADRVGAGRYQEMADSSLKNLTGPDRMALVKQAMADYDTENKAGFEGRMRQVGQKAAALGRIGSGLTTSELGDVQSNYERDRMLSANSAIRDAAGKTLDDRLNVNSAAQGANTNDLAFQQSERNVQYGAGRDAQGDRFKTLDTTVGLNRDAQNVEGQNIDNRFRTVDTVNTLNQQDKAQQRDNRDFTYQKGRDDMGDAMALSGVGYDNSQIIDTATDKNTIAALGAGQAANNQAAANYGQSAGNMFDAAGQIYASSRYKPLVGLDPATVNAGYAASAAANGVNVPDMTPRR